MKPRTGPTPVGQRLRAQTIPGKRKPAPTKEEYEDMDNEIDNEPDDRFNLHNYRRRAAGLPRMSWGEWLSAAQPLMDES